MPDWSTGNLGRRPHGSVGVRLRPHVHDCQMRLALGLDPSGRALRIGATQRFTLSTGGGYEIRTRESHLGGKGAMSPDLPSLTSVYAVSRARRCAG